MSPDTFTASAPQVLKGWCLCGHVTYEVTGQPTMTLLCHCRNCKRWTGSTTSWVSFLPRDQVRITEGESLLKMYLDTDTESTIPLERQFCSNCGTTLFVSSLSRPSVLGFPAGGIDADVSETLKPGVEVWCKDRLAWVPEVGSKTFPTGSGQFKKK